MTASAKYAGIALLYQSWGNKCW